MSPLLFRMFILAIIHVVLYEHVAVGISQMTSACADMDVTIESIAEATKRRNMHLSECLLSKAKEKPILDALVYAVRWNLTDVAASLLSQGADPDIQDGRSDTSIIWAARLGYEELLITLIERGARVDCKDRYGRTPLILASSQNRERITRHLLEHGRAKIDIVDRDGWSAIHWAARSGYDNIVSMLIDYGANIDRRDAKFGKTALMVAANNGHEGVVRILLSAGANLYQKDKSGNDLLIAANANKTIYDMILNAMKTFEEKERVQLEFEKALIRDTVEDAEVEDQGLRYDPDGKVTYGKYFGEKEDLRVHSKRPSPYSNSHEARWHRRNKRRKSGEHENDKNEYGSDISGGVGRELLKVL